MKKEIIRLTGKIEDDHADLILRGDNIIAIHVKLTNEVLIKEGVELSNKDRNEVLIKEWKPKPTFLGEDEFNEKIEKFRFVTLKEYLDEPDKPEDKKERKVLLG